MVELINMQHLAVVKKGTEAIEKWRQKDKRGILQLTGALLNELNLSRANLSNAFLGFSNLATTNLSEANLSNTYFFDATISSCDLSKANFSKADLSFANLKFVDLSDTNLSEADFNGTIINSPTTTSGKANLKNSAFDYTSFINCDMNEYVNLETIKHKGPSNIDIDTLLNSYLNCDNFERKLEPFFIQAGVPKSLIDSLPEILTGIAYCNCFVCYGEPDKAFAEKLVKDLRAEKIGCWIYSMDSTPGKKIWKEITQKRREADKMIVLCSVKSLIRDGVKKEIEEQLDEEPEKMIPISLDDSWKEEGFLVMRGKRDLKQALIDCTYADFSDPAKYAKSFRRLLKALKKSAPKS